MSFVVVATTGVAREGLDVKVVVRSVVFVAFSIAARSIRGFTLLGLGLVDSAVRLSFNHPMDARAVVGAVDLDTLSRSILLATVDAMTIWSST